jgi:transcriptional regulator with XRE-family HTH domain
LAQFPSVDTTPGQRLRQAREARGLGVRELGRLAGVDPTAISRIESGKRGARGTTEVATFVKLCAPLRVRLAWVLTGAGPMEEPLAAPTTDPYTERVEALERLAGLLPVEVDAQVRGTLPERGARPSVETWIRFALRKLDEHREGFGAASVASPKNRTGEQARVVPVGESKRKSSA